MTEIMFTSVIFISSFIKFYFKELLLISNPFSTSELNFMFKWLCILDK